MTNGGVVKAVGDVREILDDNELASDCEAVVPQEIRPLQVLLEDELVEAPRVSWSAEDVRLDDLRGINRHGPADRVQQPDVEQCFNIAGSVD